jgi:integrase/recombinase XerD
MSTQRPLTSIIGPALARYLALKETLGRHYRTERIVLELLDAFIAVQPNGTDLSPETFEQWCRTQEHLTSGVRRYRMRTVRNFCLYRRRSEPSCFVPDIALFPPLHQAVQPHIFTEAEVSRILCAAQVLDAVPGSPLRREIVYLAVVLFYTTGMRRGEVLGLVVGDYDPEARTLLVRDSKFHKSRLLPLSPDADQAIYTYLRARRTHGLPVSRETPLLCSPYGDAKPYTGTGLRTGICLLFSAAGIHTAAGRLPRIHDFRHTFAVHALLRWYRTGADVQAKLPFLAAYMGHVSIVSTQYYLHFVDQVAGLASLRFAEHYAALVTSPPMSEGGAS